jgi:transposase
MCQVRCRCRRMLSSPANDLAGELGRNSRPKPAPRPWPAQLKLSRARQTELVICDYAIERTLAWLNRNRRLTKDFEALIETAAAWLMLASVKLLLRRLARG